MPGDSNNLKILLTRHASDSSAHHLHILVAKSSHQLQIQSSMLHFKNIATT